MFIFLGMFMRINTYADRHTDSHTHTHTRIEITYIVYRYILEHVSITIFSLQSQKSIRMLPIMPTDRVLMFKQNALPTSRLDRLSSHVSVKWESHRHNQSLNASFFPPHRHNRSQISVTSASEDDPYFFPLRG